MKNLIIAIATVLVMPLQAEAAPNTVDCAIGYVGNDYQTVVITVGSAETRQNVADSGATCTEFVGSGLWVGVDKYVDWEAYSFQRLCFIQITSNESAVIHSKRDYNSRLLGYELCLAGDQQYVYYFP